jgi:hypothetical protein
MKNEEDIRNLLEGMNKHQKYIKDDYQRYGFDNFRAGYDTQTCRSRLLLKIWG